MTTNYTWKITDIKISDALGANNTVIPNENISIKWQKIGTDSANNVGVFAGATPFKASELSANTIDFSTISENTVIDWVKSVVIGDYETHVNERIDEQIQQNNVQDIKPSWMSN